LYSELILIGSIDISAILASEKFLMFYGHISNLYKSREKSKFSFGKEPHCTYFWLCQTHLFFVTYSSHKILS
jgi:hypothetical protein